MKSLKLLVTIGENEDRYELQNFFLGEGYTVETNAENLQSGDPLINIETVKLLIIIIKIGQSTIEAASKAIKAYIDFQQSKGMSIEEIRNKLRLEGYTQEETDKISNALIKK